uniref:Centrosomal protein of 126 kDa isoform X3 n=1 Tax=Geotrypetes seraphini TaxID=260995 RepID=A0A6P8RLN9_GEOSA|nr:centrosomal protein of 126 kDa isoform X3 [Geotrypetes seraphini]
MQNRRSSSYSNVNTLFEIELAEERQLLLESQKACRIRAHKLSAETNRRRKAIEEKRKEEEEKEHRFREEVLQQRRQRLQEATEKFQRAHLPPSQRRRIYRKPTPRLEDALEQIQGSVISSFYCTTNRPSSTRTADSPLYSSPIGNHVWLQKQLSTRGNYDKVIQEIHGANLDNQLPFQQKLEETQRLLETQHLSNLQNFHQEVNQVAHSESVSSLDSLEDEGKTQTDTAYCENVSQETSENSAACKLDILEPTNNAFSHIASLADLTYPKKQHVNNWFENLDHQNFHTVAGSQKTQLTIRIPSFDDHLNNHNSVMNEQPRRDIRVSDISPHANIQCTSQDKGEEKSLAKNIECKSPTSTCEVVNSEGVYASHSPAFKPSRAWSTPDPTPRETGQIFVKEDNTDVMQNFRTNSNLSTATSVICLPNQFSNSTGTHYSIISSSPVQKNKQLKEVAVVPVSDNLSSLSERNDDCYSVKMDQSNDAINQGSTIFHVISKHSNTNNMERKDKMENVVGLPPSTFHVKSNPNLSAQHIELQIKNTERGGSKLLKGILKKDSKYTNGYSGALIISRGLKIGTRSAVSIRDSVELAKGKERIPETPKANKKLRWLDEVEKIVIEEKSSKKSTNNISESQSPHFQTRSNASCINLRNMNSRITNPAFNDNQGYAMLAAKAITLGGSETSGIPLNSFVSTGYHFTKQAWMASKGEESNSSGYIGDSVLQKNSPVKSKSKLTRRPRSAKLQSAFTYKNRKGTVIRPQSATEAGNPVKSQGKIILPHPPPKFVADIKTVPNVTDIVHQQLIPPKPESNSTNSHVDTQDTLLTDQILNKDTVEKNPSLQNGAHSTVSVTGILPSPSYNAPSYEAMKKTTFSVNSTPIIVPQDSSTPYTKRSPIYGENGLRLDRTPTDEEISLLWNGVRNALAHKDHAAGDFHYFDGHCNIPYSTNVQSSRPNISHVTIDGGSLLSNLRAASRMNGFFSSPPSGTVAITRRKPTVDSNENKHRALLEQRRQIGSVTRRLAQHSQNSIYTVQINPFPSAVEPGQTMNGTTDPEEVSESTAQFLLAENMVETSAAEGEILTAMESMQPNRQTMLLNKAQHLGISALSLEEQKLLQSLDRLNQRLQYVKEATIKNPYVPGILQKNIHQNTSAQSADTLGGYWNRSMSADSRTRLQRRY